MKIHVYMHVWNEEWMLPFFFRHYDSLVDRYFVYDDGSTDRTIEILTAHPRVELRKRVRSVGGSKHVAELQWSNEVWKESRGEADWVALLDTDEFVCHANLRDYLEKSLERGDTLVPTLGFQMFSDDMPTSDDLTVAIQTGRPGLMQCKPSFFNPNRLEDVGFAIGRHSASPSGSVQLPAPDEVQLRHFKYINYERTRARQTALRERLGPTDIANGWGEQYLWSDDAERDHWDRLRAEAVPVPLDPVQASALFSGDGWWLGYRDPATWREIPGYFSWRSGQQQAVQHFPTGSTFVEVGLYLGRSIASLAEAVQTSAKDISIVGIDYCLGSGPEGVTNTDYLAPTVAKGGGTLAGLLHRNLVATGSIDKMTLIVQDSVRASRLFADASLDWVHIDARHDYASVKADIEAWLPKVKPGGWISGDDYEVARGFPGVSQAVDELLPDAHEWSVGQWRYLKPQATGDERSVPAPLSTRYGQMTVLDSDFVISESLAHYGEWAQCEIDIINRLIEPGDTVLDIGAFIGTHAMALANFVGTQGRVFAFEPRAEAFAALESNIAANALTNVRPMQSAIADAAGTRAVQRVDGTQNRNLAALTLDDETLGGEVYEIDILAIDDLGLDDVAFIKLDIEGMEPAALRGATATIKRCSPVIWAEVNTLEAGVPLLEFAQQIGARTLGCLTPAYNPENFRGQPASFLSDVTELALVIVPPNARPVPELFAPVADIDDLAALLIRKTWYTRDITNPRLDKMAADMRKRSTNLGSSPKPHQSPLDAVEVFTAGTLAQAHTQLDDLAARTTAAQGELTAHTQAVEHALAAMTASRSQRITAPLRAIARKGRNARDRLTAIRK